MYIPESLRGKGLAKAIMQRQEALAQKEGCSRIRRVPGNTNGGLFWTMQGYSWDEVDGNTAGEMVQIINKIDYSLKSERQISFLYSQQDWRFKFITANLNKIAEQFENIKNHPIVKECENRIYDDDWSHFTPQDILDMGKDQPFECAITGGPMWFGKAFLLHGGGWVAWKDI